MKRLMSFVAITTATLLQGCAISPSSEMAPEDGANRVLNISICNTLEECAKGAEIDLEENAPVVEGHPLTSVVVTQCNLVVAVYMTMPDGRLVRFDHSADIPADWLVTLAYTASRSERVEVSCEGLGAAGYETHAPT